MSEENEGEEENAGRSGSLGSDEFEFYFSFTKPLVLELPSSEDKAVAAAWVQKLEVEPASEEAKQQRLNYLKLLLFVLQRGRLSGIFKKQPPPGSLQPLPQGLSLLDVGSLMLDQDDSPTCGGGDARRVPYTIEISNDLREFVASQEVPNFGIQMYYAWSSDEPIHKWSAFDEEKFPQYILDKIKQIKEIKSDEKSSIAKDVCGNKRKGCEVTLPEKLSKKKVKSPQEIERSQGRSFHAYMGLMGRMGNFSDKCDEDPVMCFQAPSQGRVKQSSNRNVQIRCPENRGEAQDMPAEEALENAAAGLNGVNRSFRASARSCQQQQCSENRPTGGPQPYMDHQAPDRNCPRRGRRNEAGNAELETDFPAACQEGIMAELCIEDQGAAGLPQNRSPIIRTSTQKISGPRCHSEGNARGFNEQGRVCVCSMPPCTCPCPRGTPENDMQIPPQTCVPAPIGGRIVGSSGAPLLRSGVPDLCSEGAVGGLGPGSGASKAQGSCYPMASGLDVAAVRGTMGDDICVGPSQPKMTHCHDNGNMVPRVQVKLWDAKSNSGGRPFDPSFKQVTKTTATASIQRKMDLLSGGAPFGACDAVPGTSRQTFTGMRTVQTQETYYNPPSSKNAMAGFLEGLSQPFGMQPIGENLLQGNIFNGMSSQQQQELEAGQIVQVQQRLPQLCRQQQQQQQQQQLQQRSQQCVRQEQQQQPPQQCIRQEQLQQQPSQQCVRQEQIQQQPPQQCIRQERLQQQPPQQCIRQEQLQQCIRQEQLQQQPLQQCIRQEQLQQQPPQQCIRQEQLQQQPPQQCIRQEQLLQRSTQPCVRQEQQMQQRPPQPCVQQDQQVRPRSPQPCIQQEQHVRSRSPQPCIQQEQHVRSRSPQPCLQQEQHIRSRSPQPCVQQEQHVRSRSPQPCIQQEQHVRSRSPQPCVQQEQHVRSRSPQPCVQQEQQVLSRSPQPCVQQEQQVRSRSPQPCVQQEQQVRSRSPQPCVQQEQQVRPRSPQPCIQQEQQVRPRTPQPCIQQEQQVRPRSPQPCIQQEQQVRPRSPQPCIQQEQQVRPRSPQQCVQQEQQVRPGTPHPSRKQDQQLPLCQQAQQPVGFAQQSRPQNYLEFEGEQPMAGPSNLQGAAFRKFPPQTSGQRIWSSCCQKPSADLKRAVREAMGFPVGKVDTDGVFLNQGNKCTHGAIKRVPRESGFHATNVQTQSQMPQHPHRRPINEGSVFPNYGGETNASKNLRPGPRTPWPQQTNAAAQMFSPIAQGMDFVNLPGAPSTKGNFCRQDVQQSTNSRAQYPNWFGGGKRTDIFGKCDDGFTEEDDTDSPQGARALPQECAPTRPFGNETFIIDDATQYLQPETPECRLKRKQNQRTTQDQWPDFQSKNLANLGENANNNRRTQMSGPRRLEDQLTDMVTTDHSNVGATTSPTCRRQKAGVRIFQDPLVGLQPNNLVEVGEISSHNRRTQKPGPSGRLEDGLTHVTTLYHPSAVVNATQNQAAQSQAVSGTVEVDWRDLTSDPSVAVSDYCSTQEPSPSATADFDWSDLPPDPSADVNENAYCTTQGPRSSTRVEDDSPHVTTSHHSRAAVNANQNQAARSQAPSGRVEENWANLTTSHQSSAVVIASQNHTAQNQTPSNRVEENWTNLATSRHSSAVVNANQNQAIQSQVPSGAVEVNWRDLTTYPSPTVRDNTYCSTQVPHRRRVEENWTNVTSHHSSGVVNAGQNRTTQSQAPSGRVEDDLPHVTTSHQSRAVLNATQNQTTQSHAVSGSPESDWSDLPTDPSAAVSDLLYSSIQDPGVSATTDVDWSDLPLDPSAAVSDNTYCSTQGPGSRIVEENCPNLTNSYHLSRVVSPNQNQTTQSHATSGNLEDDWSDLPSDPSVAVSDYLFCSTPEPGPSRVVEENCPNLTNSHHLSRVVSPNQNQTTQSHATSAATDLDWSDLPSDPSVAVSDYLFCSTQEPGPSGRIEDNLTNMTTSHHSGAVVNANENHTTQTSDRSRRVENDGTNVRTSHQSSPAVSSRQNRRTRSPSRRRVEENWTNLTTSQHSRAITNGNQNQTTQSQAPSGNLEFDWSDLSSDPSVAVSDYTYCGTPGPGPSGTVEVDLSADPSAAVGDNTYCSTQGPRTSRRTEGNLTNATPSHHSSAVVNGNQNLPALRSSRSRRVEDVWTDKSTSVRRGEGVRGNQRRRVKSPSPSRAVEDEWPVLRSGDLSNSYENPVRKRRARRQIPRPFHDPRVGVQSKNRAYPGGNANQNRKTQNPCPRVCHPADLGQKEVAQQAENPWGSGAPDPGAQGFLPLCKNEDSPAESTIHASENQEAQFLRNKTVDNRQQGVVDNELCTFEEAEECFREMLGEPENLNRDLDLNPYLNRSLECYKKTSNRRMCSSAMEGGVELRESFALSAIADADEPLVPRGQYHFFGALEESTLTPNDPVNQNTCVEVNPESQEGIYLNDAPQGNVEAFLNLFNASRRNRNEFPVVNMNECENANPDEAQGVYLNDVPNNNNLLALLGLNPNNAAGNNNADDFQCN